MPGPQTEKTPWPRAIAAAFPHTLPVLTGYVFLGMAFGILLHSQGYGPLFALFMSVCIYAGSMQFVAVGLLGAGFAPAQAALLALMVNARHIFYGLSMLERFRGLGRARAFLIFGLTDETFSLLVAAKPPEGVSEKRFLLAITALDQGYWVMGSVLGALFGAALSMDMRGIEFAMTALFVVIFLSQWDAAKGRVPALIGVGAALLCRLLFGAQWFLLPAMGLMLGALTLLRRPLERGDAA